MSRDGDKRMAAAERLKQRQIERKKLAAAEEVNAKLQAATEKLEEAHDTIDALQQSTDDLIEQNKKITDLILQEMADRKKTTGFYTNEKRMQRLWEKYGNENPKRGRPKNK